MRRRTASGQAPTRGESGFTLMEVIIALVITVIAVMGLAYSFSTGRTLIDRFAYSRAALGAAQGRMEGLSMLSPGDTALTVGTHMSSFILNGQVIGTQRWTVTWVDDPIDGIGAADPNPNDLRRVTLDVYFQQGTLTDTLRLTRVFPAQ